MGWPIGQGTGSQDGDPMVDLHIIHARAGLDTGFIESGHAGVVNDNGPGHNLDIVVGHDAVNQMRDKGADGITFNGFGDGLGKPPQEGPRSTI